MKTLIFLFLLLSLSALFSNCQRKSSDPPKVEVNSFGPSLNLAQLSAQILQDSQVIDYFGSRPFRLLSAGILDDNTDIKDTTQTKILAPNRFYAVFFDYANNVAVEARGDIESLRVSSLNPLDYKPAASEEEYSLAREIFIANNNLGDLLREKKVEVYPPMPPIAEDSLGKRVITVGFHTTDQPLPSGIYAVDIIGKRVLSRLGKNFFPDAEIFGQNLCELPTGQCTDNSAQTGGMVRVTISQGSQVLWTFYAVRPSQSSGHPDKGSGIEIRYADYKGKRVLYRGHVPILNVHYEQNLCGPYRDWQNQEHCFKCSGTDAGNGFRFCSPDPKTFSEDLNDDGDFRGVGIYINNQEVIFVSELTAGWYRYVTEWRFHTDGTIKPRFKFGAVGNSCTCNLHFHHAYWRFDLDIHQSWNNSLTEYKKSLFWYFLHKSFDKEDKSFRDSDKKWKVANNSGEYYCIVPNHHDGNGSGDAWAKGDVWGVRYHGNELEDGVSCIGCSGTTATIQDNVFLTGEEIQSKDIVIWYRASFSHDAEHDAPHGAEIVGPDLVPGKGYK